MYYDLYGNAGADCGARATLRRGGLIPMTPTNGNAKSKLLEVYRISIAEFLC